MRFAHGEFVTILRPLDSGESTIFWLLTDALRHDRGMITCNGRLLIKAREVLRLCHRKIPSSHDCVFWAI
ncbi:MAG: ABC-type branched-subunit amino acid transport system ATPase component [Candidatus Azotimanducaceae bacterium]|jgi:ABC-type branched-subunit amino acid transport system ATPase component